MEATISLDMTKITNTIKKYVNYLYIEHLSSDNNSNIRSLLQHKSEHEKNQLADSIPVPIFSWH